MTANEKWNRICDYHEKFITESEEKIQNLWERLFAEIFGYSLLEDEIDSHRKIQLGSTERLIPDIIIKNNESDLFMVELKRGDLKVTEQYKMQLYSYLKQIHNDLGILICNQICVIDYDYNISDEEQVCCTIDFVKDNPIGIKFVETFDKCNFNKDNAKLFVKECICSASIFQNIKQQLSSEFIKDLIIDHFAKEFSEKDVRFVLDKYDFSITPIERNVTREVDFNDLSTIKYSNNSQVYDYLKTEIVFSPANETEFKKLLLIKKIAKRTWIYSNGQKRIDTWDASKFKITSSLRNNIQSTNHWRNRNETGLVKVILEII